MHMCEPKIWVGIYISKEENQTNVNQRRIHSTLLEGNKFSIPKKRPITNVDSHHQTSFWLANNYGFHSSGSKTQFKVISVLFADESCKNFPVARFPEPKPPHCTLTALKPYSSRTV